MGYPPIFVFSPDRHLPKSVSLATNCSAMAIIKTVRGFTPKFGMKCFIADNAVVVGEVIMGNNCTVWFNAVVRGDVNSITVGNDTNIQDGAVIHGTYQKAKTTIGSNVSIAHNAVVHGCTVEDNVLIGMGAIVMDDAVVGAGSVIAAGAVVLPGTRVEPGSIYAGMPARKMKDVGEEMTAVIARTAKNYPLYAQWFEEHDQKE
jgi:carbonic anhydrase/acetyltransferase-like protein (isoleucine patch superfamily)